ncbi:MULTISPECIES: hypothetical protein [unclassified Streptomyces]|uniref:hypothetical protein n=1 Tax=unclassified Streptomyces TaxID=2593676 RepID=UPI00036EF568|nr:MULTISPECIES: hypothetical protein [unclassified Streptomyces]MYT29655.1 hypothetical protein [Streptomyces sp. SID8354]
MTVQRLVDLLEIERRSMDVRPGMRHKYTPLRYAPVTGAPQIGGRYLFDTWENVRDYEQFTSQELEFEPGVKFWDRPFFLGVDRRLWRVAGAEDFLPLAKVFDRTSPILAMWLPESRTAGTGAGPIGQPAAIAHPA